MHNADDYEYSGRRSRFPPVWQLLAYFGVGAFFIYTGFDRLAEFTRFETTAPVMAHLQPVMRVHWFEKILYELGGKYLVFWACLVAGLILIGYGIVRLVSWFRLRNSR